MGNERRVKRGEFVLMTSGKVIPGADPYGVDETETVLFLVTSVGDDGETCDGLLMHAAAIDAGDIWVKLYYADFDLQETIENTSGGAIPMTNVTKGNNIRQWKFMDE